MRLTSGLRSRNGGATDSSDEWQIADIKPPYGKEKEKKGSGKAGEDELQSIMKEG